MSEQQGHGLDEYTAYLDALDGRKVTVTVTAQSKADFDRAVRESIDRTHRRQVIAGS